MTTNDVINDSLLTVGGAFVGEAVRLLSTNFWYAVVAVIVGTAVFAVREVLP